MLAAPARAGAFLPPEGHGVFIESFNYTRADRAYDSKGRNFRIPGWRKTELATYMEYGLADWLAFVGEGSWLSYRNSVSPNGARNMFAPAFAGLRVKLWEESGTVVSLQAAGLYSFNRRADWAYFNMKNRTQAELRLGVGKSFQLAGFDGFVDAQAAYRTNSGLGDELHFDLTWGGHLTPCLMLLLQSFTLISPRDSQKQFVLDQKFRTSLVYDLTESVSLQIGGGLSGPGVKSSEERSVFSSVWVRF